MRTSPPRIFSKRGSDPRLLSSVSGRMTSSTGLNLTIAHGVRRGSRVPTDHQPQRGDRYGGAMNQASAVGLTTNFTNPTNGSRRNGGSDPCPALTSQVRGDSDPSPCLFV
jgi:hypothetical protein